MLESLAKLFGSADYMPHGYCYYWRPGLVWLHAGSDVLIGTAYVAISLTLYGLVRRIRLPFSPMILSFGLFIGACGFTHYMEVWTLWSADYWLSGAVKAVTAFASVTTGVYLFHARPAIVAVTRSAELAEERRIRLESTNEELARLYAQVKELDAAKTRFFANVSHELRTPLALVIGPLERLLASPLPEPARRDLEVVQRNARLLLQEVNALLDVARLEEGGARLRYARTSLATLVHSVAGAFESASRERAVRLETVAPDATVELDADGIGRVLLNLVANAMRYARTRVRAVAAVAGDAVRFVVEDDGPGVPPEERERIFERFGRGASGGASTRAHGAGLGLAIAHDVVRLHGGTLRVADAPGGGARFEIELPGRAPAGTPVAGAPDLAHLSEPVMLGEPERGDGPAPSPGVHGGRVLLAEDDPGLRRFVAEVLAGEFEVQTAADGATALAQAAALRPDVIVTDVMMPRLSGDALVREVRRHPGLAATPVVVLTARADDALRVQALEDGANDFLVKPFLAPELLARVRNLVEAKRSREALERVLAHRGEGLAAAAREVGERHRDLQLALEVARAARAEAERASQVKSVFLGMVSHELRTPLTSMVLSLDAIERHGAAALAPGQRRALARLQAAVQRLLALVDTLLEYTRVETGRLSVRAEPTDVRRIAADVVDEVLAHAQHKLLSLALEPGPELPPVHTDPRLVRIVLLNLVVNAVKFTQHGGVRVAVAAEDGNRAITVADTGPGIPERDLERVFAPFEQVQDPSHRSVPGFGLGLTLVKSIVDALGGGVAVRSGPGGSTFTVRLPDLAAERALSSAAERAQEP